MLDDHEGGWVLCVYVGQASQTNLGVGLDNGTWGFKDTEPDYAQVAPGDFLILASRYSGGSPRVENLAWITGSLSKVIVCRVSAPLYEANTPLWPDEGGDVVYPYRFRFDDFETHHNLSLSGADELTAGMSEALRLSATKQGRGHLVKAGGPLFPSPPKPPSPSPSPPPPPPPPPPTWDELESGTLWSRERLEEVIDVLRSPRGSQVILAGPPGTGKTWVARLVAAFVAGGAREAVKVVQFHPSYGYEEFIEGLRPDSASGVITFKQMDGVVLDMAGQARRVGTKHVLILDEMNRANLPRVLGELMYLFEYRDEPVDLLYTKGFRLPENLCFIGTMNTADRSIRSIDIALRRRFEIFECFADPDILARYYEQPDRTYSVEGLIEGFVNLNARLEEDLDRHHTIGQTFFMHENFTPERLRRVWSRQLLPLVEEYFFDQPDTAAEYRLEQFWPKAAR